MRALRLVGTPTLNLPVPPTSTGTTEPPCREEELRVEQSTPLVVCGEGDRVTFKWPVRVVLIVAARVAVEEPSLLLEGALLLTDAFGLGAHRHAEVVSRHHREPPPPTGTTELQNKDAGLLPVVEGDRQRPILSIAPKTMTTWQLSPITKHSRCSVVVLQNVIRWQTSSTATCTYVLACTTSSVRRQILSTTHSPCPHQITEPLLRQ